MKTPGCKRNEFFSRKTVESFTLHICPDLVIAILCKTIDHFGAQPFLIMMKKSTLQHICSFAVGGKPNPVFTVNKALIYIIRDQPVFTAEVFNLRFFAM